MESPVDVRALLARGLRSRDHQPGDAGRGDRAGVRLPGRRHRRDPRRRPSGGVPLQQAARCPCPVRADLPRGGWRSPDHRVRGHPGHCVHRARRRGRQLLRGLTEAQGGRLRGSRACSRRAVCHGRVSRLLVITAVDIEAHGLARHLGLVRRRGHDELRYSGRAIDIVCAGPRALHLERLADLGRTAALVVSAGTCGALAPHLRAGDLVVPDVVLMPGGSRRVLPRAPGLSHAGALLSVDRVVETAESKARLWRDTAAVAVDMESAAIVEWAEALGREAVAIRGVSDSAAHSVPAALARTVDGDGRARAGRAVGAVLRRPRLLAQALALHLGTAAALRAVAAALRTLQAAGAGIEESPGWAGARRAPRGHEGRPEAPARGVGIEESPGWAGARRAPGGHGGRPEPPARGAEIEEGPGWAGARRAPGGHGGRPEPPI